MHARKIRLSSSIMLTENCSQSAKASREKKGYHTKLCAIQTKVFLPAYYTFVSYTGIFITNINTCTYTHKYPNESHFIQKSLRLGRPLINLRILRYDTLMLFNAIYATTINSFVPCVSKLDVSQMHALECSQIRININNAT